MGRKRKRKRRVQASKAAREARKQAKFAGLSRRIGHPCHYSHDLHRWHWVEYGRKIVLKGVNDE